jgi:hypothetical protein
VADIEYALKLFLELACVVKISGFPVQRVAGGRLKAAFAFGHFLGRRLALSRAREAAE